MGHPKEMGSLDKFGTACDNFSSILKTIHLFDQFMDSADHNIPLEKIEDVRNNVKAPLAVMLSYIQSDIEDLQNEMNKEATS